MSEYWIKEDGEEIFCDGDAGHDVPNHAMVVVSRCMELVIDSIEGKDAWADRLCSTFRDFVEDVVDCVGLRCALNDEIDSWVEDGLITVEESDNFYGAMVERYGVDPVVLSAACGQHDDPRVLGTTVFNWIRVIENNFDCWDLSREACNRMFEFALEHEDVDKWNVEVVKDRLFVRDVPPFDLASPVAIRKLGRRAWGPEPVAAFMSQYGGG